jgi:hypothetical protein
MKSKVRKRNEKNIINPPRHSPVASWIFPYTSSNIYSDAKVSHRSDHLNQVETCGFWCHFFGDYFVGWYFLRTILRIVSFI